MMFGTGGLLVPLLLPLLLTDCGKTDAAGPPEAGPVRVQTVKAELRPFRPRIETYGHVAPRRVTEVVSAVEGVAARLPCEVGERVAAGELIAVLESLHLRERMEAARARTASAEAAVELARSALREGYHSCEAHLLALEKMRLQIRQEEREVKRMEERLRHQRSLLALDGISREAFASAELARDRAFSSLEMLRKELEKASVGYRDDDLLQAGVPLPSRREERRELLIELNTRTLRARLAEAEAELLAARSELGAAELLCAELSIRAPAAGTLSRRPVEPGELVRKHGAVATLLDLEEIFVVCHLPEEKVLQLAEGMPARLSFPALEEAEYEGTISLIAPGVESGSGSAAVKIALDNPGMQLKPGMFARTAIPWGEERRAILLPSTAELRRSGGKADFCILQGGRIFIRTVPVRPGPSGMTEVTEGIEPGERVVDSPSPLLREGQEANDG